MERIKNGNTTCLVAVYGTLREGEGNHGFLHCATKVGSGQTVEKGTMYKVGGFPILNLTQPLHRIKVEVYEVDQVVLDGLDQLEGYPRWYSCSPVWVELEDKGKVQAWIYNQPHFDNGLVIKDGDWVRRNEPVTFPKCDADVCGIDVLNQAEGDRCSGCPDRG